MVAVLNIIVVEDHDGLREMTVEALCLQGHRAIGVDCAETLPDLQHNPPDVMVIDLNLPGEDGISLAQRVRATHPGIGIIMLTARSQTTEKTLGYESGADIYLTKPTSVEELGAALQAVARRLKPAATPVAQAVIPFTLERQRMILSGPGGQAHLNAMETSVLNALAGAPGQRMENWELVRVLSKTEAGYTKARLEVLIFRLRKKLTQAGADTHAIKVIREVGYQLNVVFLVE